MTSISKYLTTTHFREYQENARADIDTYITQIRGFSIEGSEKQRHIDKVYEFSRTLLKIANDAVTASSVKDVQSKFSKGYEERMLQTKLLQLVLFIIEKFLNFKTPPIAQFVQIQQEQPVITPDILLNSRLHQDMYELLEIDEIIKSYIISPVPNIGILVLWLVLKEGINQLNIVSLVVNKNIDIYSIESHWFLEHKGRRYWLSPQAELMLSALFHHKGSSKSKNLITEVNRVLQQHRILTPTQSVKFSDLREALKSEYILKFSPIEYGLSSYTHKAITTHLSKGQIYRLMTGSRVKGEDKKSNEHTATVRQKCAWKSAFLMSAPALRKGPETSQQEVTVKEQLAIINSFINQLEKLPRKKSLFRTKQIRDSLRLWLEDKNNAKSYPWCWVVLGWMYQLLDKGGKVKSHLKLTTIKGYINYVARPFITEFSGCDASLMTGLDWAEKLNIAAEQIQAPTKKGYLIYFAEYLIESEIAPELCISDLDIPIIGTRVNANLITPEDADVVISQLSQLDSILSVLAKLVFCFGFYCGLRRGEVQGLQFKDFHSNDDLSYFNLHIRPNKYRELKTTASSRNIPLDVLWEIEHKQELQHYLKVSKTKFTKSNSLIFCDEKLLNEVFDIVTKTIQGVVGDNTLRFHHCRHSFCNWTWVRINKHKLNPDEPYAFLNHGYFSKGRCCALNLRLNLSPFSRKKMWALAILLGHASPDTTISSYLHLIEFIRRSRFACHHPSLTLLRAFWGQRLVVDEWSHIKVKPSNLFIWKAVTPNELVFEVEDSEFDISELRPEKNESTTKGHKVDLKLVWRAVRRLAEGHSAQEVADALKLDEATIGAILSKDAQMVERHLSKSKYQLNPLINYDKFHHGNIKQLEFFINRFSNVEKEGSLSSLNLKLIPNMIKSLVGGKDSLIRTTDFKSALTMIRILQLMGLSSKNLMVKWYFPNRNEYRCSLESEYREHYSFWRKAIVESYGFDGSCIQIVVPHECREYVIEQSRERIVFSDEARFLPYKNRGYVSIHILHNKFKNQRFDTHGKLLMSSQRTRAFISFLRVLSIYVELKK